MTTVMIWNNNIVSPYFTKITGDSSREHTVTGHACVHIDDNFYPIFEAAHNQEGFTPQKIDTNYLSWAPDEKTTPDGKSIGYSEGSFMLTFLMEQYAPDHIIRIPNPPPPYIDRMRKMRQRHVTQKETGEVNHFSMTRKNCSRISSRVLRAGWNKGRGNIKYGQTVAGLWTPLMVKRLALDLKGGPALREPAYIMTWDDFIRELYEKGVVGRKTAFLLNCFQRRANNRGSSKAEPRFIFREKALVKERKIEVFPLLIPYFELREAGFNNNEALNTMAYYIMHTIKFHTARSSSRGLFELIQKDGPSTYERVIIPPDFLQNVKVKKRR